MSLILCFCFEAKADGGARPEARPVCMIRCFAPILIQHYHAFGRSWTQIRRSGLVQGAVEVPVQNRRSEMVRDTVHARCAPNPVGAAFAGAKPSLSDGGRPSNGAGMGAKTPLQ